MPYKAKPNPWIKVEDKQGHETQEFMCWKKACCCWIRRRRSGDGWQLSEEEKADRWAKNHELLRQRDEQMEVNTYGSTGAFLEICASGEIVPLK